MKRSTLTRDWLRRLPPRWLFKLLVWLGVTPPPMKALMDAGSFMVSQWMYVAARLELPELLYAQPQTSKELAAITGVNENRIGRLLYALEQRGYFRRAKPEASNHLMGPWVNTALSATMMANHPNTIRPMLMHWIEDCYRPCGRLLESMRDDACAFTLEHGPEHASFFNDFLPTHPERERQFSEAMTASSAFSDLAVLRDFDWSRFERVVDVGGSNGSFLHKALNQYPTVRGVLFDLPNVIDEARQKWNTDDETKHMVIEFASGSFFERETIPCVGANEVVVLRNILHDWPDDACGRILKNLRQAMHSDARLVLIELGLATHGSRHILEQARSGIDMLMLAMFEGKERTPTELTALLHAADFEVVQVQRTRSIAQVWEARPAAVSESSTANPSIGT